MSVVVVGAYTLDLYMFGDRLPQAGETVNCHTFAQAHGGKGANQAVAARRLGSKTALIARLGGDAIGQAALDLFLAEGIRTEYIVIDKENQTGVGFIIVDKEGRQIITTYAGAGYHLTVADIQQAEQAIKTASALLLQGETNPLASSAAAKLAGSQTMVILDPSPIEAFADINFFEDVDILTPNEQEAAWLVGDEWATAAEVSKATNVPIILLTRGEKGVEVFDNGEVYNIFPPPVQVVDTTGAGDAFNGALAAALDRGFNLRAAVANACRYASLSVSKRFCIPSYARSEEFTWIAE